MDEELLLWVNNEHSTLAGQSPHIDGTLHKRYYGYFENEYGEHTIFVYDYEMKEFCGWRMLMGKSRTRS